MAHNVNLDEREHALSILQRLEQMRRHQQQCDFVVSVDGDEFHTHRNILFARSNYFSSMLSHNTKESQLGRVEMMDVDSECVEICLNYIYTGKAEVPDGKAEQLIHVAALMQLDKLSNAVSQLLKRSLDMNTFYSTRAIAEMYNLQYLLEACKTFELENILSLSFQEGFQIEENVHIVEILTSASLTEQEKLILSLRWVGSMGERKSNLLDFLMYIRLEEVPSDYLHHILENDSMIENDFELYKIFSAPLLRKLKVCSIHSNENYVVKSLILFDGSSGCLQRLNPRTNNVAKFHHEKFEEFEHFSAIALHPYIYILSKSKSVHRFQYHGENAKWEKKQDMIEYHGDHPPSLSLNGFLYVVGGHYTRCASAVEKFSPGENLWVKLKDKPVMTSAATLVTLSSSIFSLGGLLKEGASNTFYKFNPQSEEWAELEPMRQARHSCGGIAVNQKIYVFGGKCGDDVLSDMDCYDVMLKQWTTLTPMVQSHYLVNAHHVYGSIFAIERVANSDTIEKYDIERDEWDKVKLNVTDEFKIYDSVLI